MLFRSVVVEILAVGLGDEPEFETLVEVADAFVVEVLQPLPRVVIARDAETIFPA